MSVTKEQFLAYEKVRQSGITNMYDIKYVMALADEELSREDCLDIMRNYSEYKEKWIKKN